MGLCYPCQRRTDSDSYLEKLCILVGDSNRWPRTDDTCLIYWGDGSEHATYYNRMITADRIDRC